MSNHDRRTFLRGIGAASLGVLAAGCSGDGDDAEAAEATDEPTETEAATATPAETATETPTATSTPTETSTATPVQSLEPDPGPESTAYYDPSSGFAEMAPWLEDEADEVEIRVVEETTRDAFASAVRGPNPKVVVFETSGTIDLEGQWVRTTGNKCWIAGQTAPSPGITFTRGRVRIAAPGSVVQHLRFRPGDEGGGDPGSLDALNTANDSSDIVIDHCSASWSVDEVLTVGYRSENTTVTNCLIAEPLNDSIHPKGPHGYGSLTGDGAKNVFWAGNVWAHARSRNPRLKTGVEAAVVNNVMYDFGEGTVLDEDTIATIMGNAYLGMDDPENPVIKGGRAVIDDIHTEPEAPASTRVYELQLRNVWPGDAAEPMAAEDVEEHNLRHAGARPTDRTEHDQRIIEQVRNREGGMIDSQEEVGGYPELPENTHSLDVPDPTSGDLRTWLREQALEVEPEQ